LPVRRVVVAEPSAIDLSNRLRPARAFTPQGFSFFGLISRPARTTHAALDGWLADRGAFARQNGPAILVVYTPGQVSDLCLLWNLRTLHGWPPGLPLGVPFCGPEAEALSATADDIVALLSAVGNGIGGWPVVLVSSTIQSDLLDSLAGVLQDREQVADVAEPADVLQPSAPPSRVSNATAVFDNGLALVPTRGDKDREELRVLSKPTIKADLRLTVLATGRTLPTSAVLRADDRAGWPRFSGGGCTVEANNDELRTVHWPTGWTVLRALAMDRGLTINPSASGRTAMALLQTVGDLNSVRWLANRPLLALLYRKASSSGMSWWKTRATEQAAVVAHAAEDPEAALTAMLEAIENVSVSHGGESAHTVTFGELSQTLGGRDAASIWLDWAERRNLLVRGTNIRCKHCQHERWRTIGELAPPLICSGCARPEDRPFNHTSLSFSYRLSEPLRRAIENDSIYHLLVMRALGAILEVGPVPLVGLHPGVDFANGAQGQAEADVIAVLANGDTVAVEVKARSKALRSHDLELLDNLSGWLHTPTVILATGDADDQLHPDFVSVARTDPMPVRRLLTAEDWLAPTPITTLGGRYPGPDACQNGSDVGERRMTADQYDTDFPNLIRGARSLDSAPDMVADRLDRLDRPM